MKQGGSKNKGSAFEREISKRLSEWISSGERTDLFWRSAMSGGRATILAKSNEQASAQVGDISSIHPLAHEFTERNSVECKFYKNLYLEYLVYGGKNGLVKFWQQACRDGKVHDKRPVLIAKQNYKPTIICSTDEFFIETGFDPFIDTSLRSYPHRLSILLFEYFLENAFIDAYYTEKVDYVRT